MTQQFISTALVNTLATTIANTFNSGFLEIYAGSPGPTPEDVSDGTFLMSMPLPINAFNAAVAGTITMAGQWFGTVATSGTAAWARLCDPTNEIHIVLTVSNTTGNIVISNTALTIGGVVQITSFSYAVPSTESTGPEAKQASISGRAGTGAAGTAIAQSSGDALSITGLAATGSAGTPIAIYSSSVTFTGFEAIGSAGILLTTTAVLTGLESLGSAGTPTIMSSSSLRITGAAGGGLAGTPRLMYDLSTNVGGAAGTGSRGNPTIAVFMNVTGAENLGLAGTPAIMSSSPASITGVASAGAADTLKPMHDFTMSLSGSAGTGSGGTPTIVSSSSVSISGTEATGSARTATGSIT